MNIKVTQFLFILICFVKETHSQSTVSFARNTSFSVSSGYTGLTNMRDFSFIQNQALLSVHNQHFINMHSEHHFLSADLFSGAVEAAYSFDKINHFGINAHYSGSEHYKEIQTGLAYARPLSKWFHIGAQIDLIQINQTEYKSQSYISEELAILVQTNKRFHFGAQIQNFIPYTLDRGLTFPSVFKAGVLYQAIPELDIMAEIHNNSIQGTGMRVGLHYSFHSHFAAQTGISTNPTQYHFGFQFKQKNLHIQTACAYHFTLGLTPAFSISIPFKKS